MMEKPNPSECHGDAVFVARHDDMVVTDGATSLCNELHTTLMGTLDIVTEGEEGQSREPPSCSWRSTLSSQQG